MIYAIHLISAHDDFVVLCKPSVFKIVFVNIFPYTSFFDELMVGSRVTCLIPFKQGLGRESCRWEKHSLGELALP